MFQIKLCRGQLVDFQRVFLMKRLGSIVAASVEEE